ncbi:MAG TPA: hydrogen gas-evolving membrane-bound hydrogenase subunit E [Acidimicrobiales bacterium]|jgi:multicomponent Na+:H+ antiporter subunit A|nr:hydrogen gas-evolving membrane-bound hydrogenase subunit E [Acidimicrobiales bacterium]
MILLLSLHAAVALGASFAGRRLGSRVLYLGAVAPLVTLVWLVTQASTVIDGGSPVERVDWLPEIGLGFDLRLDAFSLLMAGLVSGIGFGIFVYSRSYFGNRSDLGPFTALLVAFAGSMLGVVVADNLLLLYVFWELTSITSYLLIGFSHEKGASRAAALQAILVTGGGGLAMLGGFVLLGQAAGTYSLSGIVAAPPEAPYVAAAAALILVGAVTKSAQVPFHFWLPGAMAAPTPVSAFLHSATLVKAGVYLIARMAPVFVATVGWWRAAVVVIGGATMILGGYRALRQHDLKLLLAYGTVSQLGFLVLLVGSGVPKLTFAGIALLLAHGLFKATLFMVVGIIDHETGTRDLRRLDGLARQMPVVFGVAAIAAASMAGLPLLLGFLAKEAAYEALIEYGGAAATAVVVIGSAITFAYGARFLWGGFASKAAVASPADTPDGPPPVIRLPLPFVAPPIVLAVLTVVLGLAAPAATTLVRAAARSVDLRVTEPKLVLWHGFTVALGLSVVSVAGGLVLFRARAAVERAQAVTDRAPSAQNSYERSVVGLNRIADRVTGTLQNGSLPIYIGVILLTVLALPGSVLLTRASLPSDVTIAESPLQAGVAGAIVAASIATAVATRRFVAVLLLGAVGFGVAVLFVLQGAPDLALTQLLVETLVLVIFVLVLRHLPERFEKAEWRLGRGLRLAVALGIGAFMSSFALVAAGSRRAEPVSNELVERALPDGGGRNVVNVILTDFRAFDTMGEITVLVVAALGIASLVTASRRSTGAADGDAS